jgi:hypothetical protein
MAATKQKSYQTDERTERLLSELREGFGVTTDSAVIRRALALALQFQKIDIGKFDRNFWHGPVWSEL